MSWFNSSLRAIYVGPLWQNQYELNVHKFLSVSCVECLDQHFGYFTSANRYYFFIISGTSDLRSLVELLNAKSYDFVRVMHCRISVLGSLFINAILILVIQLFHCAIFNGYEALIVITHSCNPSSNQIRTLFWGLLGRYRKFPYLSVHGHLGNHGTLIERTSTAFSSSKGDSIWHSFTVPLYYMWTCCFFPCWVFYLGLLFVCETYVKQG